MARISLQQHDRKDVKGVIELHLRGVAANEASHGRRGSTGGLSYRGLGRLDHPQWHRAGRFRLSRDHRGGFPFVRDR